METITTGAVMLAVGSVTELIKRLGLPSKYAPLTSVALGIAFAMYFLKDNSSDIVFAGLVMGLTVSGLYSGGKALLGK